MARLLQGEYYLALGKTREARKILYDSQLQYYLKKNREYHYLLTYYAFLRGTLFFSERDYVLARKYYKLSLTIEKKIPLGKDLKTRCLGLIFLYKSYDKLQFYELSNGIAYRMFQEIRKCKKIKLFYYSGLLLLQSPGFYRFDPPLLNVFSKLKYVQVYSLNFQGKLIREAIDGFLRKVLFALLVARFDGKVFWGLIPFITKSKNLEVKALAASVILKHLESDFVPARKFLQRYRKFSPKIPKLLLYLESSERKLPWVLKEKESRRRLETIRNYFKTYKRLYERYHYALRRQSIEKYQALLDEKWAQAVRKLEKKKEELNDTLNFLNNEIQSIEFFNHPISPTRILAELPYQIDYEFKFQNGIGNLFIETQEAHNKLFLLFGVVTGMELAAPSVIPLIKSYFLSAFVKNSRKNLSGEKLLRYLSSGIRNIDLPSIAVRGALFELSAEKIEVFGAGMYPVVHFSEEGYRLISLEGAMLGAPVSIEETLSENRRLYSHKTLRLEEGELLIISVCEMEEAVLPEIYKTYVRTKTPRKVLPVIEDKFRAKATLRRNFPALQDVSDFGVLVISRKHSD